MTGSMLIQVKAVPDKKGTKGPLTPAELAVRDTIVVEWKKVGHSLHVLLAPSARSVCQRGRYGGLLSPAVHV
jgi:hypothetical protein